MAISQTSTTSTIRHGHSKPSNSPASRRRGDRRNRRSRQRQEPASDTIGPAERPREMRPDIAASSPASQPKSARSSTTRTDSGACPAWQPKSHKSESEPPRKSGRRSVPIASLIPISQRRPAGRCNRNGYVPRIDSPSDLPQTQGNREDYRDQDRTCQGNCRGQTARPSRSSCNEEPKMFNGDIGSIVAATSRP